MMSEWMQNGIDAVATTLLHSVWQGAVVAAGLFIALKVVPRSAAVTRYWWGVSAMALLVATMTVTFSAALELGAGEAGGVLSSLSANDGGNNHPAEISAMSSGSGGFSEHWQIWLVAIWGIGAGIFSLRLGAAWWGVRQLKNDSLPLADDELLRCFERVRARLGIARNVTLRASAKIDSPLTLGWWKPIVLVPVSMISALPLNHWEPIFAHELMHIRRCDFLFNLVMVTLRSVLFYHPAVGWMVRQIQIEREAACDGEVVGTTGYRSKASYARALLAVDEWRGDLRPAANPASADLSLAMAGEAGQLEDRIERLVKAEDVDHEVSRVSKLPYAVALTLALLAASVGWMMGPSASGNGHGNGGGSHVRVLIDPPDVHIPLGIESLNDVWEPNDRQLFASRLVLQVGDRIVPFGPKDPPLFEGIENAWILEHGLDYLDGQLPFRDPDGDGFSNREELAGGTSPVLAEEYPPVIGKLRLLAKRQKLYRVKFSALPDGSSVQLNRLSAASWEPKTFIVSAGEVTPDGQLEVITIDEGAGGVKLRHVPTGQEMQLTRGDVESFSIDYAQLQLAIGESEPFLVKVGDGFRLDADSGEWRLEAVAEDSATVSLVGSDEAVTVRR